MNCFAIPKNVYISFACIDPSPLSWIEQLRLWSLLIFSSNGIRFDDKLAKLGHSCCGFLEDNESSVVLRVSTRLVVFLVFCISQFRRDVYN